MIIYPPFETGAALSDGGREHAEILKARQSGNATVKVLAGQANYPSLSRNGLKSISYGRYDGSYQILGIKNEEVAFVSRFLILDVRTKTVASCI